jgi:hypothetical protein
MKGTTKELAERFEKDGYKRVHIFCGIFCGFYGFPEVSIRKSNANPKQLFQ